MVAIVQSHNVIVSLRCTALLLLSHNVIVSLRCTALLFSVSCIICLNHVCSIPLGGAHHLLLPLLLNPAAVALNPYLCPRPDW